MEDLVHTAVPPAMLGRALLAKLDAESRTAVIAAVSEEVRKEVHEAAVAEARQALEQAYADKHEALLDDLDRQRKEIERDAAAVADAEAAKQLQLDEEGFQDQLDTVRGQRQAWRARAETAEGLVVSLLTQLCGGLDQTPVYLRTITNEGLVELDRASINAVLGRSGLVLKSKATASARTVQTTLEPGQVQAHSLFWLTKAPAPGVVVAEDPDGPEKG
jgi:hypothetical protein